MDKYLKEAEAAARKAGKMLKENLNAAAQIVYKGAVDLVTNFDNQSQKMIFDHLSSCFPDHGFMAEEGLDKARGKEFRWVFDPLDGTTNYAHGFPVFCISVAMERKNEVVLGLVYDPMREEMFSAVRGGGAFLNSRRIRVSGVHDLDKSLVATGFPYDLRESEVNNIDHFNHFLLRVQAIRRCGSAAMDLCYVACGRFDGFWELKLKPWDMAAGALMVKEAGGKISDFQDKEFSIHGSEILASNGLLHQQMIQVLQQADI
ncbi:MAG: inositol monophosphatase family protein [Candidatus Aminicenantes bacterium]